MNQIIISPLTAQHIQAVGAIHLAAFPNRALSYLGKKAVICYYDMLFYNPNMCLNIGAFSGPKLLGYLVGGEANGIMRTFLRKYFAYLLLQVVTHPWLLIKPIVRERLRQALRLLKAKKTNNKRPRRDRTEKVFSVLVIAVDPSAQHRGVGKMLMGCAERTAIEKGYTLMHLSVDPENTNAIQFYQRLAWGKDREANWRGSMLKALPH